MPETVPATSKLKNYLVIIIDRSGSMNDIGVKEVVDSFNNQIKSARENSKNLGMKTIVCLVTFSWFSDEPILWLVDIDSVQDMKYEEYKPEGATAMYDCVGATIEKLRLLPDFNDEESSFLIAVISDGKENNSKIYKSPAISEMVTACEKTGRWTFTYIGANQDLKIIAQDLNLYAANTMAFVATAGGYSSMSSRLTGSINTYYEARSRGVKSVRNMFAPDDTKDKDKDA